MALKEKRKKISEFVVKQADDRFINMVYALMQEYANTLQPMSEDEFYERNRKSQKDIKANRLFTQDEVKKRFAEKK